MALHYNLHAHFAPFCPKLYILRLQKQENRKTVYDSELWRIIQVGTLEVEIDFSMISRILDLAKVGTVESRFKKA